jgi:hypothetical protein
MDSRLQVVAAARLGAVRIMKGSLTMRLATGTMQRLAIARQIFLQAREQSHKPEPQGALALLAFHDAVEIFLNAALEHCKAGKAPSQFMKYWDALTVVGVTLSEQAGMERLNKARVNLKHFGLIPAHSQMEGFRAAASNFFEENTPTVFGIEFGRISMAFLISTREIRSHVDKAETALAIADFQAALTESAFAFRQAMLSYQRASSWQPGGSNEYDLVGAARPRMFRLDLGDVADKIEEGINRVVDVFGEAITVIGYNLDFEGYRLLMAHGPVVHLFIGGGMREEWMHEAIPDARIVERCIAFVVDAALRLERKEVPQKRASTSLDDY